MTSQLLINEPPLQVLPTLAKTIGLNEAIILQQVHYWLDPRINKNYIYERHWVRNTYDQWQEQFPFWALNTIRRAVAILEEAGILVSFVTRDFKKNKYYTVDYNKLQQLVTLLKTNTPLFKQNQTFCPSTQNGQIDLLNSTDRAAQYEQIDQPNLGRSYINKDTENTVTENTPPLSTPPHFSTRQTEEEEEEEKNRKFNFESLNSPSEQVQNLPSIHSMHQNEEEELADQDHHLFSEMIGIWNQAVQEQLNPGKEVRLTDKRKVLLRKFLNEVFSNIATDQKLDPWRNYCNLIAKSRFLSGQNPNGFKVTLDWALIPDNAYKVLEGAIYDKPQTSKIQQQSELNWDEFSEELARSAPSSKYLTQWIKMSVIIAQFIGQEKYRCWFSKVVLSEVTDTTATFEIEGSLTKDIIVRQYSSELRCAVQSLYPTVHQLEFKVASNLWSNA